MVLPPVRARVETMAQEPSAIPLLPKSVLDDLRSGNDTQKELAAGALAAFASRGLHNSVLVEAGAVAPLVDVARSGSADAKTQASRALMTLALEYGDEMVRVGCIEPLVELMRNASWAASWNAGQALRNLLPWQSCTQTQNAIRAAGGIPLLVELAGENVACKVMNPAVEVLDRLSRGNDDNQVAIALAEGGVVALVKLARTGTFWGAALMKPKPPSPAVIAYWDSIRAEVADQLYLPIEGEPLGQLWSGRADAKARAIAARMLAERREVIVHKCVGAALPPEMVSLVAAFLRPRWETSSRRTKWRASESKA